ncbi:DUF2968 domain-containing protein [Frateuria aurantia]
MGFSVRRRNAQLMALGLAAFSLAGASQARAIHKDHPLQAAPAPAPASATAAPVNPVAAASVDEIESLMSTHALTELRTTYNGHYGASLLFNADKLNYYIALFHDKQFWRIIRTDTYGDAEAIYAAFSQQTVKLAQVELDAIRLQAGQKYAARLVELNQQRLHDLQLASARQQQQAQQIASLQHEAKQQSSNLSAELQSTDAQLSSVQAQIRALEQSQTNPALLLPDVFPASAGSAPQAAATTQP